MTAATVTRAASDIACLALAGSGAIRNIKLSSAMIENTAKPYGHGDCIGPRFDGPFGEFAEWAVVCTVTVNVCIEPLNPSDGCDKLQLAIAGTPEQEND